MKLQEYFKLDNPFKSSRELKSLDINEVISSAAEQIASIVSERQIEILECSFNGRCEFRCEGDYTYNVFWSVKIDTLKIKELIKQENPYLNMDSCTALFQEDLYYWFEQYLKQCDFDELEYL